MFNIHIRLKAVLCTLVITVGLETLNAQTFSDGVIKKNISTIDNPLQSIMKLQPATYEYNPDVLKSLKLKPGKQYGFLTENLHEVLPAVVSTRSVSYMYGKNNYRYSNIPTVDEDKLIPILVASIQELYKEVEQLKMELAAMKK